MENKIDTISLKEKNYKIKATYDSEKNNIVETYATLAEVKAYQTKLQEIMEGEY